MAYKTCSCGLQSGPRKKVCDCGKEFPEKGEVVTPSITKPTISKPTAPPIAKPTTVGKSTSSFLDDSPPPISSKTPSPTSPIEKINVSTKGKRQCPNCKELNGVRKQKCDCGYIFSEKLIDDDESDSDFTSKNTNKRNCLICNTEYESEDFRIDEYGKTHYYYKYARYCSSNCLINSDEIKTEIIVDIFEFLNLVPNAKTKLFERLKKDTKISNILKGIELDQKDAEDHHKYINERPKINILSPQKKKLSTPKDFKDEGISMPQLKDRKIVEEPKKESTSFLDIIDE